MDLYRITHPLRLAKGSHQPGSGRGCAMNVISYINGDAHVTDFPTCSATPLSLLVQTSNDLLAAADGYLSPGNSVLALELAWQTMGTADVPDTVVHAWIAELLSNPTWGVLRYASLTAIKSILDIADLHRAAASGNMPPAADWEAAKRAAQAMNSTSNVAGEYALRTACDAATFEGLPVDNVIAHALNAHAAASEGAPASRIVELTRHAIRSWRDLAELDDAGDRGPVPLDRALELVA
jgi:hypothetical protein